jgi:asparagine synthase (glutamine-hydrolysing)
VCGIAGILADRGRPPPEPDRVRAALRAMAHRGPDGAGVVARGPAVLGNCRLAIVDPANGAQPMEEGPGGAVLTQNGEIHDHVERRRELEARGEVFRTNSDTEVLLKLLARYGPPALADVTGMFAFAFFRPGTGELLLGRDAFGVKPLLVARDAERGETLFASEVAGLVALGHRPRLDLEALAERLAFNFPLGDRTLLAGVRTVPPGRCLHLAGDGRCSETIFSRVVFRDDGDRAEEDFAEELRGEIVRSVRLSLRADAPLGVTLSGGLDSGLVGGVAVREGGRPLPAFTGYFDEGPEFDERVHARRAAAEADLRLVEVPVRPDDLLARIRDLAVALEGPIAGPGTLPQLLTASRAARDVRVLLTGQGADELFGGYARHRLVLLALAGRLDPERLPADLAGYRPLARRLAGFAPGADVADLFFRLVFRGDGVEGLLGPAFGGIFRRYDARAAFEGAFAREDGDPFRRMASFERRTLLPALLHGEDRVSMRCSVESRVPLLSPAIVSLAARIPSRFTCTADEGKRILRRAAEGIAPPSAVARRDKMGFPVPLGKWAAGPLGAALEARLAGGPLVPLGILAPDGPGRIVAGAGGHGRHLWFFLLLSEWLDAAGVRP